MTSARMLVVVFAVGLVVVFAVGLAGTKWFDANRSVRSCPSKVSPPSDATVGGHGASDTRH